MSIHSGAAFDIRHHLPQVSEVVGCRVLAAASGIPRQISATVRRLMSVGDDDVVGTSEAISAGVRVKLGFRLAETRKQNEQWPWDMDRRPVDLHGIAAGI